MRFPTAKLPASRQEVAAHVTESLDRCDAFADKAVWINRLPRERVTEQAKASAAAGGPLAGITLAVKDNIDVAGIPTTAACPDFSHTPQINAFVIDRLMAAGAVIIGKTNMDQFATGLVGTRSPYGICQNVFNSDYISGGSSSGSGVAVAAGLVDAALGTDTAGSGRVPAAFGAIVGFKPSKGLLSTTGVIPACRSLDCVSIFTRTCDLAAKIFTAARAFDARDEYARRWESIDAGPKVRSTPLRFGVPAEDQLEFFGNDAARSLFSAAVARAEAIGLKKTIIDYEPFQQTAKLLYDGPWVAERLLAVAGLYKAHPEALLPVIRTIIDGAQKWSAADLFAAMYQLAKYRRMTEGVWSEIDVLLLPTAPTIYTIAAVNADPIQLNKNLGIYTNFVNLLDLCALALPAGMQPDGLPFGITWMARAGHDERLLTLGGRWEKAIGKGDTR